RDLRRRRPGTDLGGTAAPLAHADGDEFRRRRPRALGSAAARGGHDGQRGSGHRFAASFRVRPRPALRRQPRLHLDVRRFRKWHRLLAGVGERHRVQHRPTHRAAAGTVLAGGASQTFSWQYDVSGSGTLAFAATASGTDADSGTPVSPPAASAPAVEVQAPGALAATATASPGQVSAGLQQVSLVLTLQNAGGAAVRLDALPTPAVTAGGSAAAALSSSPPSPAGDLLAGGTTRT